MASNGCFLRGRGPCSGPTDPHHLVLQQRIKREFPRGVWRLADGQFVKAERTGIVPIAPFGIVSRVTLGALLDDPRNIVPLCRRHHDQLHAARQRISRASLPAGIEEFAAELGMTWSLDRDYGKRVAA